MKSFFSPLPLSTLLTHTYLHDSWPSFLSQQSLGEASLPSSFPLSGLCTYSDVFSRALHHS